MKRTVKLGTLARKPFVTILSVILLAYPVSSRLIRVGFPPITSGRTLTQSNLTYTVDRLTDTNPTGGGEGSGLTGDLRYAMSNARSGDSIILNVSGTVNLSGALPLLTKDVNIEGPKSGGVTVQGNGTGNIFAIEKGITVVLSNVTISGGVGNGGGIFNGGTLTLNHVTVSGNSAGDPTNGGGTGAGIWNYIEGTLTLNNSTVSGNTTLGNSSYNPSRGGGIANYGTLTLNNSTVSGNSASEGFGGGISNALPTSTLTLKNSTVTGNSATGVIGLGGGIDNHGTLYTGNTIIAGNTDDDLYGAVTSSGHNLISDTSGNSGFQSDLGDLLNIRPLLGPLGDNGGLTRTHALLAGSPAIDHGDDSLCPQIDQRGSSRPEDGDEDGNVICDIGAYELGGIPTTPIPIPVTVDVLTPTLTPSTTHTPTPTIETPTVTSAPPATPTSTPAPPLPGCSRTMILFTLVVLVIRTRRPSR